MTSESKYGSARNSLVWLGVAKSTHRASERVRGSGRGKARQGEARRGLARHGLARQTHSGFSEPLQFARQGVAGQGLAWQGPANTQRLTGRCSLSGLGAARHGEAGRGAANTQRLFGAAAVCSAWPGRAWRGRAGQCKANTQRLTGRCSLLGWARQGGARRGMANTQRLFGAVAVCFAGHGKAWRGLARHGKHAALLRKRGSLLGLAMHSGARQGPARQGVAQSSG